VTVEITWEQALAFRMRRHLLDPVGTLPVVGVVRRLCGVQAQVASSAELAVRVRRRSSRAGEIARALSSGRLIKTWAMRGTLHLVDPEEGGAFLSLIAGGRSWEGKSWDRFGITPRQMEALHDAVRDALDGATLTREELVDVVTARPGLGHARNGLRSSWGSLLKPLAWQGDLCFGPSRGTRVTFTRPDAVSSRWAGVPDPEEAAPVACVAFVGAYGPTTIDAFTRWLGAGRRRLRHAFRDLGDRLAKVEVAGEPAFVLAEHLDEVASIKPTKALRLLPGFDQYVLGPGTTDGHVVPAGRRSAVSKQSGWIAPVVLWRGAVAGTWEVDGDRVRVAWFTESGRPPRGTLHAEVGRLSEILGRDLRPAIGLA
jgi:DNA glycosylase AlkZ-like